MTIQASPFRITAIPGLVRPSPRAEPPRCYKIRQTRPSVRQGSSEPMRKGIKRDWGAHAPSHFASPTGRPRWPAGGTHEIPGRREVKGTTKPRSAVGVASRWPAPADLVGAAPLRNEQGAPGDWQGNCLPHLRHP